jgi:DNA-directed RNA polymerase subunit omega
VYKHEDSMMHPRVEHLLEKVDSKFTLVSLGATRARMLNDYNNNLGKGLGSAIPLQVTSVARKHLSSAFEEIAADKIVVGDPPIVDEAASEEDEVASLVAVADGEATGDAGDDGSEA